MGSTYTSADIPPGSVESVGGSSHSGHTQKSSPLQQGVSTMAEEEQVKKAPEPTYEVVWVKAANRDNKVALWDVHPQHPNREHEVYLADGTPPVQAALTPEVQRALGDRRLVKSSEAELKVYYAESQKRQEAARAEELAATPMAVPAPAPAPAPEPVADPDPEKRGPGRPAGNKAP